MKDFLRDTRKWKCIVECRTKQARGSKNRPWQADCQEEEAERNDGQRVFFPRNISRSTLLILEKPFSDYQGAGFPDRKQ